MDMDFAKIMQMMNASGGGGNKDMSMLMQLLPQLMNNNGNQNKQSAPAQINLNPDEINKTINKLYNDNE